MLRTTKSLLIVLHSFLLAVSLHAQQAPQTVLGNTGASSTAITGYTIDYTVGEAVIQTIGSTPILTQGFHQPLNAAGLPIHLLYFRAEGVNGQSRLSWKTATESNNRYFAIERSGDGLHFNQVSTVASKAPGGNSTLPLIYNYTDMQPLAKNYYRLRQVDIDGHFTYSPVVIVSFDAGNQWLLYTYPNPVQQQLNLVVYSAAVTTAQCTITSVTGQPVHMQKLSLIKGSNMYTMPVGAFPAGTYFVRIEIQSKGWAATVKFVKQ